MLEVFLSTAAGSVKAVRAGSDGGPGAFISTEAVVMRGFKALRNLYLKEVNIIQIKNCFGEQVLTELQLLPPKVLEKNVPKFPVSSKGTLFSRMYFSFTLQYSVLPLKKPKKLHPKQKPKHF